MGLCSARTSTLRHPAVATPCCSSAPRMTRASESNVATARDLAARGYVVAIQDIRGRYASDGDFIWQFQDSAETFDAQDGYDAVEWAARLPGSDGQGGTWGHSYPSWCIWQLAGAAPPPLGAHSLPAAWRPAFSISTLACSRRAGVCSGLTTWR